ncbi:hypothetical protein M0R45_014526 [Rubus argutus]|uniref:AT-hook motif nuclear-localized protein n=1 Tax=Rubus argutus TaxID=59490 RepID=A0AAW1XLI5_RUBAR
MNSSAGQAFAPHVITIEAGEICKVVSDIMLVRSYLVADDGGPRDRTGGISVSLSSFDAHVIGDAFAMLIAATPVQVVLCSFVYGGSNKIKSKPMAGPNNGESPPPTTAPSTQDYAPSTAGIWPGARLVDARNAHTCIDLTRG